MESNWRWNVWNLGLTTFPVDLVAELRTPIPPWTHVGAAFGKPTVIYWLIRNLSPISGILPYGGEVRFNLGGLPFPFGFDVLPDQT